MPHSYQPQLRRRGRYITEVNARSGLQTHPALTSQPITDRWYGLPRAGQGALQNVTGERRLLAPAE